MHICSQCNAQYPQWLDSCPGCGRVNKQTADDSKGWTYIASTKNDAEFALLEDLMDMAEIPVAAMPSDTPEFLSTFGFRISLSTDLLVPEDRKEEAMELLSTSLDEQALEREAEKPDGEESSGGL